MTSKRIFIIADHGMAVVYFLESDVLKTLIEGGVEVVLLTDDPLIDRIRERFGRPGLIVESLRLKEAREFENTVSPTEQYWLSFLRRAGGSRRINTEAMDSYIRQVDFEAAGKRRLVLPFMKAAVFTLRRSSWLRKKLVQRQMRFSPDLYTDLFEKYDPALVVGSTPGWRLDRYLLRQAVRRGVRTATVIVGWDNSSSYNISGAPVEYATCWSDLQKDELMLGSDWPSGRVNVGGIPSYDGYFREEWIIPRQEYFQMHGLDPERKLLSYACSFISFSPNYQNVSALAKLVSTDQLVEPSQLLIRLHPTHFQGVPLFEAEANRMRELARKLPYVHVVEPVALGGELGHYGGEDMPEKTSMMVNADVFLTVYSTMVVEAAIHDRPVVAVCIDAPDWDPPQPDRFLLPLSEIGDWPTHKRFRDALAGRVAVDEEELKEVVNLYLSHPDIDRDERMRFIREEVTYLNGSAGRHTGEYLLSLIRSEEG